MQSKLLSEAYLAHDGAHDGRKRDTPINVIKMKEMHFFFIEENT